MDKIKENENLVNNSNQTQTFFNQDLEPNELLKGTYVISDPCYVLSDKNYDIQLGLRFDLDWTKNGKVFKLHDKKCFVGDTRFGDGIYFDNKDNSYCVDSGQIGCFPIEICDNKKYSDRDWLNTVIYFDRNFKCYWEDGIFYIGGIVINTKTDNLNSYISQLFDEKKNDSVN